MAKKKDQRAFEDLYCTYEGGRAEGIKEGNSAEEGEKATEDRKAPALGVDKASKKLERLAIGQRIQGRGRSEEDKVERPGAAAEKKGEEEYRSPICCILGHVDTGKTKILDRIRETDVQLSEAGGITQQIGATYIPASELQKKYGICSELLPGILVIDTPGHEAFANLRSRGSSLCNIAILVIDVMHGLEPQTKESIEILRSRKTPFIIALNKIDRIAGWVAAADEEGKRLEKTLRAQSRDTKKEFKGRLDKVILELANAGLNGAFYADNPDPKSYVSIVPTSAITGEGIANLLSLLIGLVETKMKKKVRYTDRVECTVLEVRPEEGKQASIDVILSSGVLNEGDKIVLCSRDGPIETVIRNLLTPQPMKETRVKGQYKMNKSVRAAIGVRVVAPNLEGVLAGSRVLVPKTLEETAQAKREIVEDIRSVVGSLAIAEEDGAADGGIFGVTGEDGVHVQASTLGSLEALIGFLKKAGVPIRTVGVGNLNRKDVIRASSIRKKRPEYAVMLCFDIEVSSEIHSLAREMGVKVMGADIIYHLEELFKEHLRQHWEHAAEELKGRAVFPCILKIVPNCVFTKRSPLLLGVRVEEGILRTGTPLCIVRDGAVVSLGKVTGIQEDNREKTKVDRMAAGGKAAIKVEVEPHEQHMIYKRHFDESDDLISRLSRDSIDLLKENFRDALSKKDWMTVIDIKRRLGIF